MSAVKLFVEALKWTPLVRATVRNLVTAMGSSDEDRVLAAIEALRRAVFLARNVRR